MGTNGHALRWRALFLVVLYGLLATGSFADEGSVSVSASTSSSVAVSEAAAQTTATDSVASSHAATTGAVDPTQSPVATATSSANGTAASHAAESTPVAPTSDQRATSTPAVPSEHATSTQAVSSPPAATTNTASAAAVTSTQVASAPSASATGAGTTAIPPASPTGTGSAAPPASASVTASATGVPVNGTSLAPTPTASPRPKPSVTVLPVTDDTTQTHSVIGAGLSLCGNVLISIALNVQKYAHAKNAAAEVKVHYLKQKLWWIGMVLMITGELGNFAAYAFAPASLVAPLGTATVISNAIIAPIFNKEPFRRRDLAGVIFAVVGAFVVIYFLAGPEAILDSEQLVQHMSQPGFIVYVVLLVVLGVCAFFADRRWGQRYLVIPLLVSAVFGSFTVLSAKAVSTLLTLSFNGDNQFVHPLIYFAAVILGVTAVMQVKFLNKAMQTFKATEVVPTFFVLFTIAAILAGIVLYGDFDGLKPVQIGMFFFGCCLTFVGVYLITSKRAAPEAPSREDSMDNLGGDGAELKSIRSGDGDEDGTEGAFVGQDVESAANTTPSKPKGTKPPAAGNNRRRPRLGSHSGLNPVAFGAPLIEGPENEAQGLLSGAAELGVTEEFDDE